MQHQPCTAAWKCFQVVIPKPISFLLDVTNLATTSLAAAAKDNSMELQFYRNWMALDGTAGSLAQGSIADAAYWGDLRWGGISVCKRLNFTVIFKGLIIHLKSVVQVSMFLGAVRGEKPRRPASTALCVWY